MFSSFSPELLAIGALGIVLGLYTLATYLRTRNFVAHSIQVHGTVVDIVERSSLTNAEQRETRVSRFSPVIEFTPRASKKAIRFLGDSTSHANVYTKKQPIAVRYLPNDPATARIDQFLILWKKPLIVGVGSLLLIGVLLFGLSQT